MNSWNISSNFDNFVTKQKVLLQINKCIYYKKGFNNIQEELYNKFMGFMNDAINYLSLKYLKKFKKK